jgi:hypothetical protein
MPKMTNPDGRTKGAKGLDYGPMLAAYLADFTLNQKDIAARFGCSYQAVNRVAMLDKWSEQRAEVKRKTDEAIHENAVKQRLLNADDFNVKDLKFVETMRGAIARETNKLNTSGKLDSKKILELSAAWEKAQKIGRLALDMSTNNNELTGKGGQPLNAAPPVINVSFTKPDNEQAP